MKKLSELKISPTPWKVSDSQNYWIEDAHRTMVCDGLTYRGNDEGADEEEHANARFIVAAPKLYDAAERLLRFHDESCIHGNRTFEEITRDYIKAMTDLKTALAEAAGESEVK